MSLTETLRPNGNGSIWKTEGDYTRLNDDNDATSIGRKYFSTDLCTFPNLSIPLGAKISSVSVRVRIKSEAVGYTAYAQGYLYISGSEYLSAEVSQSGDTWAEKTVEWTTNPDTGLDWTISDIDNMEAGVDARSSSVTMEWYCSELWLIVEYDLLPPAAPRMW